MPLLWRIPDEYGQNEIGRYDRVHGPDRFVFLNGSRLSEPLGAKPRASFNCRTSDLLKYDCIWTDARIPIVSERLKDFLAIRAPQDIQVFGMDISAADGDLPGYYLLNVSHSIDVIDVSSSTYRVVPGSKEIMSFSDLRLIECGMENLTIGRDKAYPSFLFVGEGLANEIHAARFFGVALLQANVVV